MVWLKYISFWIRVAEVNQHMFLVYHYISFPTRIFEAAAKFVNSKAMLVACRMSSIVTTIARILV